MCHTAVTGLTNTLVHSIYNIIIYQHFTQIPRYNGALWSRSSFQELLFIAPRGIAVFCINLNFFQSLIDRLFIKNSMSTLLTVFSIVGYVKRCLHCVVNTMALTAVQRKQYFFHCFVNP